MAHNNNAKPNWTTAQRRCLLFLQLLLQRFPALTSINPDLLKEIGKQSVRVFQQRHSVVIAEGETPSHIYFVENGEFALVKRSPFLFDSKGEKLLVSIAIISQGEDIGSSSLYKAVQTQLAQKEGAAAANAGIKDVWEYRPLEAYNPPEFTAQELEVRCVHNGSLIGIPIMQLFELLAQTRTNLVKHILNDIALHQALHLKRFHHHEQYKGSVKENSAAFVHASLLKDQLTGSKREPQLHRRYTKSAAVIEHTMQALSEASDRSTTHNQFTPVQDDDDQRRKTVARARAALLGKINANNTTDQAQLASKIALAAHQQEQANQPQFNNKLQYTVEKSALLNEDDVDTNEAMALRALLESRERQLKAREDKLLEHSLNRTDDNTSSGVQLQQHAKDESTAFLQQTVYKSPELEISYETLALEEAHNANDETPRSRIEVLQSLQSATIELINRVAHVNRLTHIVHANARPAPQRAAVSRSSRFPTPYTRKIANVKHHKETSFFDLQKDNLELAYKRVSHKTEIQREHEDRIVSTTTRATSHQMDNDAFVHDSADKTPSYSIEQSPPLMTIHATGFQQTIEPTLLDGSINPELLETVENGVEVMRVDSNDQAVRDPKFDSAELMRQAFPPIVFFETERDVGDLELLEAIAHQQKHKRMSEFRNPSKHGYLYNGLRARSFSLAASAGSSTAQNLDSMKSKKAKMAAALLQKVGQSDSEVAAAINDPLRLAALLTATSASDLLLRGATVNEQDFAASPTVGGKAIATRAERTGEVMYQAREYFMALLEAEDLHEIAEVAEALVRDKMDVAAREAFDHADKTGGLLPNFVTTQLSIAVQLVAADLKRVEQIREGWRLQSRLQKRNISTANAPEYGLDGANNTQQDQDEKVNSYLAENDEHEFEENNAVEDGDDNDDSFLEHLDASQFAQLHQVLAVSAQEAKEMRESTTSHEFTYPYQHDEGIIQTQTRTSFNSSVEMMAARYNHMVGIRLSEPGPEAIQEGREQDNEGQPDPIAEGSEGQPDVSTFSSVKQLDLKSDRSLSMVSSVLDAKSETFDLVDLVELNTNSAAEESRSFTVITLSDDEQTRTHSAPIKFVSTPLNHALVIGSPLADACVSRPSDLVQTYTATNEDCEKENLRNQSEERSERTIISDAERQEEAAPLAITLPPPPLAEKTPFIAFELGKVTVNDAEEEKPFTTTFDGDSEFRGSLQGTPSLLQQQPLEADHRDNDVKCDFILQEDISAVRTQVHANIAQNSVQLQSILEQEAEKRRESAVRFDVQRERAESKRQLERQLDEKGDMVGERKEQLMLDVDASDTSEPQIDVLAAFVADPDNESNVTSTNIKELQRSVRFSLSGAAAIQPHGDSTAPAEKGDNGQFSAAKPSTAPSGVNKPIKAKKKASSQKKPQLLPGKRSQGLHKKEKSSDQPFVSLNVGLPSPTAAPLEITHPAQKVFVTGDRTDLVKKTLNEAIQNAESQERQAAVVLHPSNTTVSVSAFATEQSHEQSAAKFPEVNVTVNEANTEVQMLIQPSPRREAHSSSSASIYRQIEREAAAARENIIKLEERALREKEEQTRVAELGRMSVEMRLQHDAKKRRKEEKLKRRVERREKREKVMAARRAHKQEEQLQAQKQIEDRINSIHSSTEVNVPSDEFGLPDTSTRDQLQAHSQHGSHKSSRSSPESNRNDGRIGHAHEERTDSRKDSSSRHPVEADNDTKALGSATTIQHRKKKGLPDNSESEQESEETGIFDKDLHQMAIGARARIKAEEEWHELGLNARSNRGIQWDEINDFDSTMLIEEESLKYFTKIYDERFGGLMPKNWFTYHYQYAPKLNPPALYDYEDDADRAKERAREARVAEEQRNIQETEEAMFQIYERRISNLAYIRRKLGSSHAASRMRARAKIHHLKDHLSHTTNFYEQQANNVAASQVAQAQSKEESKEQIIISAMASGPTTAHQQVVIDKLSAQGVAASINIPQNEITSCNQPSVPSTLQTKEELSSFVYLHSQDLVASDSIVPMSEADIDTLLQKEIDEAGMPLQPPLLPNIRRTNARLSSPYRTANSSSLQLRKQQQLIQSPFSSNRTSSTASFTNVLLSAGKAQVVAKFGSLPFAQPDKPRRKNVIIA